jgi:hypothetical protein
LRIDLHSRFVLTAKKSKEESMIYVPLFHCMISPGPGLLFVLMRLKFAAKEAV